MGKYLNVASVCVTQFYYYNKIMKLIKFYYLFSSMVYVLTFEIKQKQYFADKKQLRNYNSQKPISISAAITTNFC